MARADRKSISNKNEALNKSVIFAMNNRRSNSSSAKSGHSRSKFVNSIRSISSLLVLILVFAFAISTIQGLIPTDSNSSTLEVAYANGPGSWKRIATGQQYVVGNDNISESDITNSADINGLPYGVYQNTTSAFDDNARNYFSLGSDASKMPSINDLKYNADDNRSIGFVDYEADSSLLRSSDYSFVWWIDIIFIDNMLLSVKNGNVELTFSCNSDFSQTLGISDESAPALQWIFDEKSSIDDDPIDGSRGGSDASWTNIFQHNCFFAGDFVNGDGSWKTSETVNRKAIGVRLVFGAISDYALQGGFYNIDLRFKFANNGIIVNRKNENGTLSSEYLSFNDDKDESVTAFAGEGFYVNEWITSDWIADPIREDDKYNGISTLTINRNDFLPYATLSVTFAEIKYNIMYYPNYPSGISSGAFLIGGKAFVSPTDPISDAKYGRAPLDVCAAGLENWTFDGWLIEAISSDNGNSDIYSGDEYFPYLQNKNDHTSEQTINLYAYWKSVQAKPAPDNDGITKITTTDSYVMYADITFEIEASKVNHTLVGVYAAYLDGDLSGSYVDLEHQGGNKWKLYAVCGNCELYPVWQSNIKRTETQYHVTFDSNGGTLYNPQGSRITTYDIYYLLGDEYTHNYFPYALKSGYTFCGWTKTKNGTDFVNNITATSQYKDVTLYANWISNSLLSGTIDSARKEFGDSEQKDWKDDSSFEISWSLNAVNDTKNKEKLNNIFGLSSWYDIGYAGKITSAYSTTSSTGQNGATSTDYFSKTRFLINNTQRAYTYIDEDGGTDDSSGTKTKTGSSNFWGYANNSCNNCKLDGDSYKIVGTNQSAYSVISGIFTSSAQMISFVIKRQYAHASGSSYSVKYCSSCTGGNYHEWSKISYSMELTGTTRKGTNCNLTTISYSHGYTDTIIYRSVGYNEQFNHFCYNDFSQNTDTPDCSERIGYHFMGWAESNTSDVKKVVYTGKATDSKTYYAVWQPIIYPIVTYDVFSDETNNGVELRQVWKYQYQNTINLNNTKNDKNTNNVLGTVNRFAGNNFYEEGVAYLGFESDKSFVLKKLPKTLGWTYTPGSEKTSYKGDSIGVNYAYFQWKMKKTKVAINGDNVSVNYGNSIDLDDYLVYNHEAESGSRIVTYENGNWYSEHNTKTPYTFYVNGVHSIYLVSESGKYYISITAHITIGGISLSTISSFDDTVTNAFTINPLSVKLINSSSEYYYNGMIQTPPFDIDANDGDIGDGVKYSTEELKAASNTIRLERSGKPWFYDAVGNNYTTNNVNKWNYGIALNLVAQNFSCALGLDANNNNYYNGLKQNERGFVPFRDAGTYTPYDVELLRSDSEDSINENYYWYNTKSAQNNHSLKDSGYSGTIPSATIYPRQEGVVIYFTPSYKMFGVIADPLVQVVEGSYNLFKITNESSITYKIPNMSDFEITSIDGSNATHPYICVDGLIEGDFEYFESIFKYLWSREEGNKAGSYNVLADFNSASFNRTNIEILYRLYNNYGIQLDTGRNIKVNGNEIWSGNDIGQGEFVSRSGGIGVYYVGVSDWNNLFNSDGSLNGWNVELEDYTLSKSHPIFNIQARTIDIVGKPETDSASFVYDGKSHGFDLTFAGFSSTQDTVDITFKASLLGIRLVDLPTDWDSMTDNQKSQWLSANIDKAIAIGVNGGDNKLYYDEENNINHDTLSFAEINAGSYGIVLCGFDGGNYELNIDGKPFYEYRWEIKQLAVTFVSNSVANNTLGDPMYGGYTFSFKGLLSGDGIKILTDISTPSSCGFRFTGTLSGDAKSKLNYSALSDISEHLSNNFIENNTTFALFAKYAGNYSIAFTLSSDNSTKEHSGNYGDAYETNYKFSSKYKIEWTVNTRELSGPEYTSTVKDWIYEYNVAKGKTVAYSGFWSTDFKDNDIAPTVLTDLVENKSITVIYELNGSNGEGVNIYSDGIGGFSATFKGINQGKYSPIVNSISSGDIQTWTIKQSSASTVNDGQFVILPKTVLLTWRLDGTNSASITYDAKAHTVTADLYGTDGSSTNDNKIYSGDSATIRLSGDVSQTNAGTYRAVASLSSTNYSLVPYAEGISGTSEYSWEILRLNLTVVYPDNIARYTYDGDSKSASIAVSNFPEGGTIDELNSLNTLYETDATITSSSVGIKLEAKNAGTYTVKAKNAGTHNVGTNYTITIKENELNEKTILIIDPRTVSIAWNTDGFKYNGDMLEIEYDATPKALTAIIVNKVNNDDVDLDYRFETLIAGDADRIKVGTYRTTVIGLKGASCSNYTIEGTTDTEREWSIVKRVLTVVWYPYTDNYYNSQSTTVNGFFTTEGGEPESGSGKTSDPYVYYYNGNNAIGVYCVVSGLVGSDSITVTLNGSGEFYYIFDGRSITMPTSGCTISSSNQSAYRFASTATAVSDAIYTVSFSANNDNYDISYRHADGSSDIESASYKITKREVRISVWSMSDAVDNSFTKVYDGVPSTVTATMDGIIPDSNIELSYSDSVKNNVGNYIVKIIGIDGADKDNYSLPTDTHKLQQAFSITARTVDIAWSFVDGDDNFTKVYNGSNYTLEAELSNIIEGDSVAVSRYRTDYIDGTNLNSLSSALRVGEYATYALELNNSNYRLPDNNSIEWSITPFELNISWIMSDGKGTFTKVYDGRESVVTASVNKIGSDDILLVYTTVGDIDPITGTAFSSSNSGVNVNTYTTTITLDGTNMSDYALPNDSSKEWSITPRTVSLSWSLDGKNEFEATYDGNDHTISCDISNKCLTDIVSVELKDDFTKCVVGNYTANVVKLIGAHSGNYTLDGLSNENGVLKCTWSITPRTLGITFDGVGGVYKKDNYTITVKVTNIVNSDYPDNLAIAIVDISGKTDSNIGIGSCNDGIYTATVTSINVGLYGIEVDISGDRSDCYTLPDTQWTWEITALGVSVSWSLKAPIGGSINGFVGVYAKGLYTMEASPVGVLSGDQVNLTLSGNTAVVKGNYTATVDVIDNPNYSITNGRTQTWEIAPKTITVIYWTGENSDRNDFSWVYDGTAKAPVAHAETVNVGVGSVSDGKVYEGDSVSFTYTYSGDRVLKGNYSVTVTALTDNVNYILGTVDNATQEMEITPRTLTVAWSGDGGIYNKQNYIFTFTVSNLIPSDIENEFIIFNSHSADGYLAVIDGGKALSGNSLVWSFSAINAGLYSVSVDISGDRSSCYTFATATKEFEIEKSEIGIEWNMSDDLDGSFTKVYNGVTSIITAQPTGVYSGDSVTLVLSGDISSVNAKKYTAWVQAIDGVDKENYKLPNNISRSWQIEKLAVVLDWTLSAPINGNVNDFKGVYAKNDYTLSATVTNAVGNDTVTVTSYLTTGVGYNSSSNTALNVGAYTTRAVTLDNDNYTLVGAVDTKNWEITPKAITEIYWSGENSSESDFSWVYDGTLKAPKAHAVSIDTANGKYNDGKAYIGDNVSFEYNYSGEYVVGTHSLSVTAVIGNSNYVLGDNATNISKEYTITAKTLEIVWSGSDGTYNGSEHIFTATVSGILNNDYDLAVILSATSQGAVIGDASFASGIYTQAFSSKNAGDYSVTLTIDGSRADCYTFSNGTKSVTKNWTIDKKALTVEFTVSGGDIVNGSVVYDAQNHGYSFTLVGLVDGESVDLAYNELVDGVATAKNVASFGVGSTALFVAKSVSSYGISDITVSSATANVENYSFTSRSVSWDITPRVVELSWSMGSAINYYYRASDYSPVATVTNIQNGDSLTVNGYSTLGNKSAFAVSGEDGVGNIAKDVDNYRTKALSLNNVNYTLDGAINTELSWSILPKTIVFNWIGDSGSYTDFSWDYDGTTKSVGAVVDYVSLSVGNDTDGKVYEGDSVSIVISNSSNILADSYIATATGTNNSNYVIDDNLTRAYSIEKRKVMLSWTLDSGSNDYSGNKYGYTLTAVGFVSTDYSANITIAIDTENAIIGTPTFTDNYSIYLSGINADDYSVSVSLSGARADCYYIDGSTNKDWNINKKEITAIIGESSFDYKAERIENDELNISFSGLVSNESLTIGTDYKVEFDKEPIYAGSYVVTIDMLPTAVTANYSLVGQQSFGVSIDKHSIDMSELLWKMNDTEVDIDNLVFVSGEHKTFTLSITDPIFNKIDGKQFTVRYFGFCTCGASAQSSTAEGLNMEHQWFDVDGEWQTSGPEHAGIYWAVVSFDSSNGDDRDSFVFENFDNYTNSAYFTVEGDNTYLRWNNGDKAIDTPLPTLGDNVAAVAFGIQRAENGATFAQTPKSLPFSGSYYTVTNGLPFVTAIGEGADMRVTVNGRDYNYTDYTTAQLVRNAGKYSIRIYDKNASASTIVGCDLFNTDATLESNVILTVEKQTVTINNTASIAWSKVYDRTVGYADFTYENWVAFVSQDNEGVISSAVDGVIEGTSLTISAVFDSYNAGSRSLIFTLDGADKNNYTLNFSVNDIPIIDFTESDGTFVIVGGTAENNVANGNGGYITKKAINANGLAEKVFDGTDEVKSFTWNTSDIISGDTVSVSGHYAQATVGDNIDIVLSSGNDNYIIESSLALGRILPKRLTVSYSSDGSVTYDGISHGVVVTIGGMIDGFIESISVSGDCSGELTGNVSGTFTAINVGDYSISLSLPDNSNYYIAKNSASWQITKRTLGITWSTDNLENEENAIYVWNTENDKWTVKFSNIQRWIGATFSNIVEGETLSAQLKDNVAIAVGEYTAVVIGIDGDTASNYTLPIDTTKSWAILKAEVKTDITGIILENKTVTYNSVKQTISVNKTTTQHGIAVSVSYKGGEDGSNGATNVGEYTITATIAESESYFAWSMTATLTIEKANIEGIGMASSYLTYDGKDHCLTVDKSTTQYGESVDVSYSIVHDDNSVINATNVGVYTVTATLNAGNNYKIATLTNTLEITRAEIKLTWSNTSNFSGIYSATMQGVQLSVEGIVEGDKNGELVLEFTHNTLSEYTSGKNNAVYDFCAINAGVYTISVTLNGDTKDNYTVTNINGGFTINKKAVTISGWEYQNGSVSGEYTDNALVYNGSEYTLMPKLDGVIGSDIVDTNVSGNKGTNAYTYSAKATLEHANYSMNPVDKSWVVSPKTLTVDWNYTTPFVYDRTSHEVTAKLNGICSGDIINITYISSENIVNKAENAGAYTAKISSIDNTNYILPTDGLECVWSIEKADIDGIILSGGVFEYDGNLHTLTVNKLTTQHGVDITVSYKGGENDANGATNVGKYTITATISAGDNYNDKVLPSSILEITPVLLGLNWKNSENYSGIYSATHQGVSLTVSGIVSKDSNGGLKLVFTHNTASNISECINNGTYEFLAKNAGDYSVSVSLDGANKNNYSLPVNTSYSFAIKRKTLTITKWMLGDDDYTAPVVYNKTERVISAYTADIIYNGDTVNFVYDENAKTNVGSYQAVVSISGNANYELSGEMTKKWSIIPKPLNVVWQTDIEKTYNHSEQSVTATLKGVIEGDIVNIVYDTTSGKAYKATDVGSYTAVIASINNGNYTLPSSGLSQDWSIKQAKITTVTFADAKYTYDGSIKSLVVKGDKTQYDENVDVTYSNNSKTNAGDYIVTATVDGGKNYEKLTLTATLKIEKATLEIAVNGDSVVYDGEVHTLVPTFVSGEEYPKYTLSGNTLNVVLSADHNNGNGDEFIISSTVNSSIALEAKNAGTYHFAFSVTPADGVISDNYIAVDTITAVLTIEKADMLDSDGTKLEQGVNIFLNDDSVDYSEEYVGITVSRKSDESVCVNAEALLKELSIYTSKNIQDTATVAYSYSYTAHQKTRIKRAVANENGVINAGIYSITVTVVNDNYKPIVLTAKLTISRIEVSVTWVGTTNDYTYSRLDQSNAIGASFKSVKDETKQMTVEVSGVDSKKNTVTEFINAGTYTFTASYNGWDRDNYIINDSVKSGVVMNKYVYSATLNDASMTYDGNTYYLLLNTGKSTVNSETITVLGVSERVYYTYQNGESVLSTNGIRNVGVYTVVARYNAVGTDGYNPNIEPFVSREATFTVNVKDISVNIENPNKVYDGDSVIEGNVIVGGIVDSDRTHITVSVAYSDKNVATTKRIIVSLVSDDEASFPTANYKVPENLNGKIEARKLDVDSRELQSWQKDYDGTTQSAKSPITLFADGFKPIDGDDITVKAYYNSKNVLEANSIRFSLEGEDANNYLLDSIKFNEVDHVSVFLIKALNVGIEWGGIGFIDKGDHYSLTYDGYTHNATALIRLKGDDITTDNNGILSLTVSSYYVKKADGTSVTDTSSVALRNAGTYNAVASTPAVMDDNMRANYGITATARNYVIEQASVAVQWSLRDEYIYNGTEQTAAVSATAVLLGEDKDTYQNEFIVVDYLGKTFKNADKYAVKAVFNLEELTNNYKLINDERTIEIKKANITNLKFQGSASWTYYSGEIRYFFVTMDGDYNSTYSEVYYEFDLGLPITVNYSGGENDYQGLGKSGIKNVGEYTITASVANTLNYNDWSSSITVTVEKGTIDNVFLKERVYVFDGNKHYVYASNNKDGATDSDRVELPDGSSVTVNYRTLSISYYNKAFYNGDNIKDSYICDQAINYAEHAGQYKVGASISGQSNYKDWSSEVLLTITQKVSSIRWYYNGLTDAKYSYNAKDQSNSVTASIVGQGIQGNDKNIYLSIAFTLKGDDLGDFENLKNRFVLAGDYTLVAGFAPEQDWEANDYKLEDKGITRNVTIQKFVVELKWYFGCCEHKDEEYTDESICVYNKKEHSIVASGLGLDGVEMRLVTSGDFKGINAGAYSATVSKVEDGTDNVVVDGISYEIPYALNYVTPTNVVKNWSIDKRIIDINIDSRSHFVKVYDGTLAFEYSQNYSMGLDYSKLDNVDITYTYNIINDNYDGIINKLIYTISNVIKGDEHSINLTVKKIESNSTNTDATIVFVIFDDLTFGGGNENYDVNKKDGISINYPDKSIIQPLRVKAVVKPNVGHIYNGLGLNKNFILDDASDEVKSLYALNLSYLSTDDTMVDLLRLIKGNYFIGSVRSDDGSKSKVGIYELKASLKVVNSDGISNYVFIDEDNTIIFDEYNLTGQYSISARKIELIYDNLLQSYREPTDVTAVVDLEKCDLTDLEWGIDGYDSLSLDDKHNALILRLKAILVENGMATNGESGWSSDIRIVNRWNNSDYLDTLTAYTNIIMNQDKIGDELLLSFGNMSNNFLITTNPTLKLTYIRYNKFEEVFDVYDATDILNLANDASNLQKMGITPKYCQQCDISMVVRGSLEIVWRNEAFIFKGTYDGCGYTISDLMILSSVNGGLFGQLENATIKRLNIERVNGVGISDMGGIIASKAVNSIIEDVTVSGIYTAYSSKNAVKAGFIVAESGDTVIKNAVSVGYLNVYAFTATVGGMVGEYSGNSDESIGNVAFVDTSVVLSGSTRNVGPMYGSLSGTFGGIYLKNSASVYLTDGTSLFANGADDNALDYSEFKNSTDENVKRAYRLVKEELMRNFTLLPNESDILSIGNYRQLILLSAYGWLDATLVSDIYIPYDITVAHMLIDSYYGVFKLNGKQISSIRPTTYRMFILEASSEFITVYSERTHIDRN